MHQPIVKCTVGEQGLNIRITKDEIKYCFQKDKVTVSVLKIVNERKHFNILIKSDIQFKETFWPRLQFNDNAIAIFFQLTN